MALNFRVGNRFIDILAVDDKNNYVVIELKVSRGYDRVVRSNTLHCTWHGLNKTMQKKDQKVRGIILGGTGNFG